ncbi:hypothetical protein B9Z19DRAFT_1088141 [Tuber borchii]|uniref:Uncharacterized protein n=1 Tax=Tuber borchii TaxID=42251 RepID=A0A2T6ZM34_TUBBO|nr:hypothetical protein B9Z19DRAFT_1088141 [Tuber borchii]
MIERKEKKDLLDPSPPPYTLTQNQDHHSTTGKSTPKTNQPSKAQPSKGYTLSMWGRNPADRR